MLDWSILRADNYSEGMLPENRFLQRTCIIPTYTCKSGAMQPNAHCPLPLNTVQTLQWKCRDGRRVLASTSHRRCRLFSFVKCMHTQIFKPLFAHSLRCLFYIMSFRFCAHCLSTGSTLHSAAPVQLQEFDGYKDSWECP